MNFYLNGTQIYAETNTTLTERVGTFSDGTLPLEISNVKNAILPMSTLRIENNNDNWYFVVISDSVEIVQKKPALYKHNIVVKSKEYELTKHLLRNNEFSQPKDSEYIGKINFCVASTSTASSRTNFSYCETETNKRTYSWKNISLNSRTKIMGAKMTLDTTLYCYTGYNGAPNFNFYDLVSTTKNAHNRAYIRLERYDNNLIVAAKNMSFGSDTEIIITPDDAIFQNLTDTTELRLVLRDAAFRFNTTTNNGCLALVNIQLKINTYYYSLLDIVQQISKQSEQHYNGHGKTPAFELTTNAEKVATLNNTIAPEISFTGVDIYQALYQLFSYIDAIPTLDNDGKLTFDYLNNNNQASVSVAKADEKITLNDEYFTNKLVANYQRGKQENAITYPARNKLARVSTKSYGVPSANDYIIPLPKPIDYIDKVELTTGSLVVQVYIKIGSILYRYDEIPISKVDITEQVLENSIYQLLDSYSDYYAAFQNTNNCFTYSKGGNYIDLLGNASLSLLTKEIWKYVIESSINFIYGLAYTQYRPSNSYYNIVINETNIANKFDLQYNVQYHAIYDGRVEQISTTNKYDGQTYVNQETSNVSLNRMGNNLQGLIAKLGNETENITLGVSSYGSRMRVGSLWVDDDGNKYIANVVRTTFSTSANNVIVEAEFTKNFNLISQFTKVDQEKRFYEISNAITSKGYENITEYIYFDYTAPTDIQQVAISENAFKTIIKRTLSADTIDNYYPCDFATFRAYNHENDITPAKTNFTNIPLHIYGSGNSLCFEVDFDSSINAGNRLTGSTNLYTKTTLYTEELGFADMVEIKGWHSFANEVYLGEDFPEIGYGTTITGNDSDFTINYYKYFKKPNEIFHLNYALAFMGNDFYFGNKFIEQNGIMANNKVPNEIKLYIHATDVYSIIDNKVLNGSTTPTATITFQLINITTSKFYYQITISTTSAFSCKSWALADENGNVYIASNKTITNDDEIIIYVIPQRNRI